MKLHQLPGRVVTGAFILHSGLGKWRGDEATAAAAAAVHGMAAGAYPVLKNLDPPRFLRLLAAGEIATGVVLLAPIVPEGVAGAALTGFCLAATGSSIETTVTCWAA
ncbi:MAG TPA: DoxX family membrane protein [Streptosporangiaceae bacterium]|nr:DoxX family membrane protein [Streptosporangiaceae bacterium]